MSPERAAKLACAVELIESTCAHLKPAAAAATLNALVGIGATFKPGANTNTLRFAGITATCTWHDGTPLIASWHDKAKRALAEELANV